MLGQRLTLDASAERNGETVMFLLVQILFCFVTMFLTSAYFAQNGLTYVPLCEIVKRQMVPRVQIGSIQDDLWWGIFDILIEKQFIGRFPLALACLPQFPPLPVFHSCILYYKHRYVRGLDLMQCFVYKPFVEDEGAEYLSKNNRNLAHTDAYNTVHCNMKYF